MVITADTKCLQPEALFRRCDPTEFKFNTTAELEDLTEFVGQDRAPEAVQIRDRHPLAGVQSLFTRTTRPESIRAFAPS